ncbi:type II secretion system protein M [Ideonella dechloratans]|uniref:Type II secretion system protein M n=1 Tax=Ideonella dechloratans TaxID=36863 RepID=A0A643FDV6_IDEDE|nr:type II secretion system protein GspM [Ideonella dechloratans]KAB0581576.1 type II secretion system protein M [Ideonella dechloratans]UFU09475.1 type II secretion system protein M [Ideonella dechloratans]
MTDSSTARPSLASALAPLQARWQTLNPRERTLVSAMLAALGLLLLWMVLVRPVWKTWREVPAQAEVLEAQWLQMQRLASEAQQLKGQSPITAAQATEALQTATQRLGAVGQLAIVGDRATLTLKAASPDQLRSWLGEARQGARTRPIELQLQRDGTGHFSGRVVVALPGQP